MKATRSKGKTYGEKLLDPRWQKKRLEVMERDKFKCRSCHADSETLHVHHLFYDKGAEPWEYEESALLTLCKTCHSDMEQGRKYVLRLFTSRKEIERALGFLSLNYLSGAVADMGVAMSRYIDAVHGCVWVESGDASSAVDQLNSSFRDLGVVATAVRKEMEQFAKDVAVEWGKEYPDCNKKETGGAE